MAISDISIKNPVMAWMIFIGIFVFGVISYMGLGVSQMPDVDFPVLNVSTTWPGAAPDVMESTVTDPIEEAIMGVQGVTEVRSTSSLGISSIDVQFDLSVNIDVAVGQVQSKIAAAQKTLPTDIYPPVITKTNSDDTPIIWIAASGSVDKKFLMEYTRDVLTDAFSTIPNVAAITLGGYLTPTFRVWLDPVKMKSKEITYDDIISAVTSGHEEVPAGFFDTGTRQISIRVPGEASSAGSFEKIIIPERHGSPIWKKIVIGDVARVEDGLQDLVSISRSNGEPAIGLGIRKQPGSNSVEVAHAIKKKVADLQKYLPKGVSLTVRFDTSQFIENAADDMRFVLILSVILTAIVCWLFLGSFSSAINIFLTIPMAILGALFCIKMAGFTLNTFTFLGLSLVIGIVVDDAIMVLENITRHREEGDSRVQAAIKGAREITFAALAATVAILAIFLPVIFMQGVIGRYFFQFGITISAAVAISLLGALTVTPMFSAQFLKTPKKTDKKSFMDGIMDSFRVWYKKVLAVCLNNRWKVVVGAFVFFAVSMASFYFIKVEFVPSQDMSMMSITVQTPAGSSIHFADDVFKNIEAAISTRKDVLGMYTSINNTGGSMSLTLKQPGDRPYDPKLGRKPTQSDIMNEVRLQIKAVPGVSVVGIMDMSLMGFSARRGYPVEFMLEGQDWNTLSGLCTKMTDDMIKTGLMVDADEDYKTGVSEELFIPDRKKAFKRGVTVQNICDAIDAFYGFEQIAKFTNPDNGKRYGVVVELEDKYRTNPDDIDLMQVRNDQGQIVNIGDVITKKENPTVLSYTRENRQRAIRVFANVAPGKSQGEAMDAVKTLAKKLPEGYQIFFTGSSQTFQDSFSSLYIALILGIFVAYMVLGTQFNSFVHPIAVLLALPFSLSGAFIALALSGKTLNVYSAIGIILLM